MRSLSPGMRHQSMSSSPVMHDLDSRVTGQEPGSLHHDLICCQRSSDHQKCSKILALSVQTSPPCSPDQSQKERILTLVDTIQFWEDDNVQWMREWLLQFYCIQTLRSCCSCSGRHGTSPWDLVQLPPRSSSTVSVCVTCLFLKIKIRINCDSKLFIILCKLLRYLCFFSQNMYLLEFSWMCTSVSDVTFTLT